MEVSGFRETVSVDIHWILKFVPSKVNKTKLISSGKEKSLCI